MNHKKQVEKILAQAIKRWALDDWEITWQFGETAKATGGALIQPSYFTEHRAHIELDESLCDDDPLRLKRNIYHELGHAVIYPVWRGMSDWTDHYIRSKRQRLVYEEQANTRENEVIDFIVAKIFKI